MNNRLLQSLSLCLALTAPMAANAQEHRLHHPEKKWLLLAEEQFSNGQYVMAGQSAMRSLQEMNSVSMPSSSADDRARAVYFLNASRLRLNEPAAEDSAILCLRHLQQQAYRDRLSFALAQFYFRKGKLAEAIPYYEAAGIDHLSNPEIADAKFERAYSYFNNRQFEEATPLFATIKEVRDGKYYSAGNYYYGLLAYHEGKYEEALTSFKRIDNEPQYSPIVPYYMAEIYYFTGNRKKALEEAMRLMKKSDKLYYDNELHLLAAQVLFEEQRYGDALPYFEHYYDNTDKIRKEELYEMGYSYYRVNEWKNAIEKFKPLSNTQDSLGQTAMYLLGDCYLKTGDKRSARNAFGLCSEMPFSPGQREASLLLHARISYELGYDTDAARSVATMLKDYPASDQRNEAKTLQSELYLNSGDYDAAFTALSGFQQRDATYGIIYQRAAYGRALQVLQSGRRREADSLLTLSLLYPVDNAHAATAHFWKSDIAYHTNRPVDAIREGQDFLTLANNATIGKITRISPVSTVQHANLNMGYAALDAEDYAAARSYFSKARTGTDNRTAANAALREGDAAFMLKDFTAASNLYDKAQTGSGSDADYAKLQKAILLGLQGKSNEKATLLQSIIAANPPSSYLPDARYELASVYFETKRYDLAVTQLQPLASQKNSAFAAKAMLKLGNAYEQQDQDAQAIEAYRKVVSEFATSPERNDALKSLKNLYIEGNQPESYAQLLKENNLGAGEDAELDSAFYAAAESRYAAGQWQAAQQGFDRYLQQYPQGVFSTKANYYKAESYFQQGDQASALNAYKTVLDLPWSDFSETSASRAAGIAYNAARYDEAIGYYSQLRNAAQDKENLAIAYTGIMRSNAKLDKLTEAAAYADTLLTLPELPEAATTEARLYQAKRLQADGKAADAFNLFKDLQNAKNGAIAAEARYNIAEYYLKQGKLKEAEEAANRAIKLSTGNDLWVVKSYLVYADVLVLQKDYFNAKAILESIVKNNKNESLRSEASAKLEEVKKAEQAQSKLSNE